MSRPWVVLSARRALTSKRLNHSLCSKKGSWNPDTRSKDAVREVENT
jgi:hypothetical protein